MKKKKLILDGLCIEYIESDTLNLNNCIVFLHGWMQDCHSFSLICEELDQNDISFISLSFPWFWSSDIPKTVWGVEEYKDFVVHFLEKLNIKSPMIIWHSFGGRIWILLWADNQNISKLVLMWAAWIKPKINYIRLGIVKAWKIFFNIPWLRFIGKKIKNKVSSVDYNSAWKLKDIFLKVINKDLSEYIKQIQVPTLLIWWEKDTETPLFDWEMMQKNIIHSKLLTYKDGAHFVFQEFSNKVTKNILDFLKN